MVKLGLAWSFSFRFAIHKFSYWLTDSLARSLTHSLALSPTHSLARSLTRSLTHSPHSPHSLAHSLTHSLARSLTCSLADLLTHSPIHLLARSSPTPSLSRSLAHSHNHSFAIPVVSPFTSNPFTQLIPASGRQCITTHWIKSLNHTRTRRSHSPTHFHHFRRANSSEATTDTPRRSAVCRSWVAF